MQINGLELNGKEGTVVGQDEASCRIIVHIELKPTNLTKLVRGNVFFRAGARVRDSGLTGAVHLNDKEGNIVLRSDATGGYIALIDDEGHQSFKPENLTKVAAVIKPKKEEDLSSDLPSELREVCFNIGCQVRVGGLSGAMWLNGQAAVIFGYDKEAGRYFLKFKAAGQKKIKTKNMFPRSVWSGALSAKVNVVRQLKAELRRLKAPLRAAKAIQAEVDMRMLLGEEAAITSNLPAECWEWFERMGTSTEKKARGYKAIWDAAAGAESSASSSEELAVSVTDASLFSASAEVLEDKIRKLEAELRRLQASQRAGIATQAEVEISMLLSQKAPKEF